MSLDPAWIALIGTICGGVGLKLAEHWLGRNKVKTDDATQMRSELRLEITAQKEEIKQLELDVNRWRDEYYKLYEKHIRLQTELSFALKEIKTEITEAELKAITDPPIIPPTP